MSARTLAPWNEKGMHLELGINFWRILLYKLSRDVKFDISPCINISQLMLRNNQKE